ncbi:zinc ABC transporter permease [Bowdeniella nasicola]|uniref:Zinc ABC transporter permease n=1 Tax=Bowdeniella nasicola TaxID=208480 RepID=A0A1Q5Q396_9ACTO|nr:metal ABC transporter permease [Bowdeniella nasicola]OKL54159.1 zinc ABC transporter permease [Bowdeniella nasicola]
MSFAIAVFLLARVTAVTSALPGTFLVLRRQSMLVDAMSHAALPGIVLAALVLGSINSPWLIVGAGAAAMLVVFGAQWLRSTGLITGDADQALVFPALFSVGIILISTRFAQVHLHEDAVLVGDLNFAAFHPLILFGRDFGPQYMWLMLGVLALNALFLAIFYRPLTLSTFDEAYARSRGIATGALNYALMALVAINVVAAFNAAGAVLLVALMIVPPATALLIARTVPQLIAYALGFATLAAGVGFWLAYATDAATSATMAAVEGVMFLLVWGVVAARKTARARKLEVVG